MKVSIVICVSVLLLVGCKNAVDQFDFKNANEFCAEKEGVYQIWIDGSYGRIYECKNGSKKSITRTDVN